MLFVLKLFLLLLLYCVLSFLPPFLPCLRLQNKSHFFIDHFAVFGGFANISYCSNIIVYDNSLGNVNLSDHWGLG